jgi:hypothetical protein
MLVPVPKPLPLRTVLALGRALGAERWISLDPDVLVAQARRNTALHDYGDDADRWREGLDRVCSSAETDARLSVLGRVAVRQHLVRSLENRLLRHHHPRTETTLVPPIIVSGMPRSGTTFLHRLLAEVPGARALKLWEVQRPYRPAHGPDRRRAQTIAALRTIRLATRDLDAKHFLDVDEPEECMFLLDDTFQSMSFWVIAPVFGYLEWYRSLDMAGPYRSYRQQLEWFQAETPDRRLTLKAPVHTPHLDALVANVPEALLVQTHRNPVEVLASMCSLMLSVHSLVSEELDVPRMIERNLAMMDLFQDRSMAIRDRLPDGAVFDVRYDELLADPVDVVRRIHAHFSLPFDGEAEARLRSYAALHPQGHKGVHRYASSDLGVDLDALRARYRPYVERYLSAG